MYQKDTVPYACAGSRPKLLRSQTRHVRHCLDEDEGVQTFVEDIKEHQGKGGSTTVSPAMATVPIASRAVAATSGSAFASFSQRVSPCSSSTRASLQCSLFTGFRIPLKLAVRVKKLQRRESAITIVAATNSEEESIVGPYDARFRLNNLAPQPGSRRKEKRKGRGISAGQGASCGFGMRGQKSRSGSGVRPGFEGGQKPLYRQLPKLRGIAGGMPAGLSKHVIVNLDVLNAAGEDIISLESLKASGFIKPTGRERRLRLKILGDGEVTRKFTVTAAAFSASAREKLEQAGCTIVDEPGKKKFVTKKDQKLESKLEAFLATKI